MQNVDAKLLSLILSLLASAFGLDMAVVLSLCVFVVVLASCCCDSTDLYKILGLKQPNASIKEIKSAYRRKAIDTHPDKRSKDVSAEEAAEAFRQVVHAFEILSDENSRRRYDRGEDVGSSTSSSSTTPSSSSSHQWHFQRQQWNVQLKDKLEVKQAQARVLHVVSIDQLRTIMLDDNDRLDRNLLICFFTPKLEEMVNDKLVFPYPFAGMSPQHIWWEDLLQTVSIRFHRSSDLSRYFNVPNGGDEMTEPLFMFLKRGTKLGDSFEYNDDSENIDKSHVYSTSNRDSFEKWMWSMIEVKVEFINQHSHPVELYWIHSTRATMKEVIQPNTSSEHFSMLTHEFYARDNRVDDWAGSPGRWKLSKNSSLGSWKIGVAGEEGSPPIREDENVKIIIPHKTCMDMSGHCSFWANQKQCNENPTFMRDKCMLTCDYCSSDGAGAGKSGSANSSANGEL